MSIQLLVEGTHRSIYQDTASINGGTTQQVLTRIRTSVEQLARVQGLLVISNPVGAPVFTATPSVSSTGLLVVTITNTAAPGNAGSWMLDVRVALSLEQGSPLTSLSDGYILVANGAVNTTPPAPATETLNQAYVAGSTAADQTLVLATAHGGGLCLNASTGGASGAMYSLEVRQDVTYSTPVGFRRWGTDAVGPILEFTKSRGIFSAGTDVVISDVLGAINFKGRVTTSILAAQIASVVTSITSGLSASIEISAAYQSVLIPVARLSAQSGLDGLLFTALGEYPIIRPQTFGGSLGEFDARWDELHVDTANVFANVCMGGILPGAGAMQTLMFPIVGTVEPSTTVGQIHVCAAPFVGGSGLAALTIVAEEPENTAEWNVDTGIPIKYNGQYYYLCAHKCDIG